MKGDFTRFTFLPAKHYDAVLSQQGRVQTDADWNEQVMIAAYRNRNQVLDIVGRTGAPQDLGSGGHGPFLVYYAPDSGNVNRIYVDKGRYYVDGLMVESEIAIRYDDQPGTTLPPLNPANGQPRAGTYLVYLDVWRRHVTALEDPGIREVALAGADSGTRSQLVWQARMEYVGDLTVNIAGIPPSSYGASWYPLNSQSTGAMDVQAGATPLENQLYRVEVHRGGTRSTASFKWSRDNGTVVAKVLTHSTVPTIPVGGVLPFNITVDTTGRDTFSSFLPGQMVELSNEELVFQRRPGVFASITSVVGNTLNLEAPATTTALSSTSPAVNPLLGTLSKVRRWDNAWNPDLPASTLANVPGYMVGGRPLLERDITVNFAGGAALYQTGDYWLVPARTVSGLEDWVAGQAQVPAGEAHDYAPLALVKIQANGTIANVASDLRDMRDVFPTLRSLVGGTGSIVQGTGTKDQVPKWQSNGGSVLVNSTITDDGSKLTVAAPNGVELASTLKVSTAGTSVAIKRFTGTALGSEAEPAVVATMRAVRSYVDNAVGGAAGTLNQMAKFTGAHTVGNSIVSDNGSQVSVGGTLKVGSQGDSVAIAEFSSTPIQNVAAGSLGSVVPTDQAVKSFMAYSVPPGTVMAFGGESIPSGWLECNGQQCDGTPNTTFAALFSAVQKLFGGGNGSTYSFNVPDLRGRFIRGWAHGSSSDPDRSVRSTGDHVGSYQGDQYYSHQHYNALNGTAYYVGLPHSHWNGFWSYDTQHDQPSNDHPWIAAGGGPWYGLGNWQGNGGVTDVGHSHSASVSGWGNTAGGNETRPRNVYLTFIIKF